jgi:hypothetical protein
MPDMSHACAACAKAHAKLSGEFQGGCRGCAARAVSRGPNFRRCRDAGRTDRRYLAECAQHGVSHEEVRAEAARDAANRKEPAPDAL